MKNYIKFVLYLLFMIGVSNSVSGSFVDYFRAVNVDNDSTVKELLDRGFDPNTLSEQGQTALYLAIREKSFKVAEVLLASPKLKVDVANASGETALMMAALQGQLNWSKRLIERGAKVQRDGWTPLHYAASGPNVEVVALMLDRGANIDSRAPNGNTALMQAARYGDEENVKLLVRRGADKSALNQRNQSAADLAQAGGRPWLLPLLE